MTPREWCRRFRKGWDDGRERARVAKAARFAQDIPESIPAHYMLADGSRVDGVASLMGTTVDGYLRYVLTVSVDAVGAGVEILPGKSVLEVVAE